MTTNELLTQDLPDPTIPVPPEQFRELGQSSDILQRAAYWAYYASWLESDNGHLTTPTVIRARHDGNILKAYKHCVIIPKEDIDELGKQLKKIAEEDSFDKWHAIAVAFIICVFFIGMAVGIFSRGIF